ncbi:MAG: hypothetical protein J6T51_00895 [Kiritimatiellae bacterium]|nr:hypothetical protein [Kiritimatiellia bacterium]
MNVKKLIAVAAVAAFACAGSALGAAYEWSNTTTAANLGPETSIDSTGQIDVYCGTVNINEGAFLKFGGDQTGGCNYIGVDRDANAAVNINGGTLWCAKSNGSGYLGIGINSRSKAYTATLTLNSGTLKVDGQIRSAVGWNSAASAKKTGTVTINGGTAEVGQFVLGSTSGGTGSSVLNLNGGSLTLNEMYFRACNGQTFTWGNGTLVAGRANVFRLETYTSVNSTTRTMQITGAPASFDTAGFAQSIPAFTGTGKLRLTGGGAVTFEQATLTYGLIFDGIALNLGTLDAGTTPLTTPNLEIIGPATLNVTLPASPTGRYPLIACTSSLDGSLGQITVSGGGAGVLVRDGNTLYLSFDPADAAIGLVYSTAAGGADTPAESSYTRLAFTDTAGAFMVGGSALALSQDIADESASAQTVTAPVTLSTANSSIYVAEGGCLTLSGGLTATTPRKDGPGKLVLDNATIPSMIVPRRGVLDLGGNTYSGTLNFGSRRYHGEEITLTNGTWRMAGQWNWQGSTVTIADGFTIDLTGSTGRVGMGYAGVDNDGSVTTKLIIDGGTFKAAGDRGGNCNFVAVDRWGEGILEVKRGTFHANGANACIRIGVNNRTSQTGIVRVSGGLFKIDNDLSLATAYNGTGGATSNGKFELSGGVADVNNFYLGATSSNTGRGEVTLTGGVLEVGVLKCLAYNKQTLLADGATIRAKRDDTAASPFMARVASADSYAKSYTIGTGGLMVDTAGHDVHCDIPWTGEGGLTIMGDGGSLALGAPSAFTGNVVISNGTALVMTNSATFAGTISFLGADSKIRIDTTSYQEDSLTIATDGFTLPSGVTDVLDLVELVGDGYVASVSADGKSIELGLAANVAAFAWWTGGGDPADLDDPDNWACTNSNGGVVEGALPVKSTIVVLSGSNTFAIPSGTTPIWAATHIGYGGAATLSEDCDWSSYPNLVIADGSYIDLNGHNLKVSYLSAVEGYDGAYVTNSVAGTKPALWAENKFSETTYIDTENVRVCTDCVEVKSVNNATFTAAGQNQAMTLDAAVVVTNGAMTVTGDVTHIGGNNHSAVICVSNNASATFTGVRLGHYNASNGKIVVADNATFRLNNFINVGNHNSGESVFIQSGGTVSSGADFNIGVGNTSTSRYEIASGSLTVGGSFVIGRLETTAGFGKLVQSGGTVRANKYISIGWNNGSVGLYYMSGGEFFISANRANLGSEAAVKMGIWDISGGTATTAKGLNVAQASGSTAKLRLSGSGKLVTADITGNAGASTVEFDGGTLAANADNAAFIKGITNVVFGANAVTLDTAGHNLGITNCVLKATPGARAITLTGGGTLDFMNATLDFTAPLTRGFVLAQVAADDTATFTSVPALAPGVRGFKVKLYADGKTIKVLSKGCVIIVK